jgi:hypothetical protein
MIEPNAHHDLKAKRVREPGEDEQQWLRAEQQQQRWLRAEGDEQEWLRTQQEMFARER